MAHTREGSSQDKTMDVEVELSLEETEREGGREASRKQEAGKNCLYGVSHLARTPLCLFASLPRPGWQLPLCN